MTVSRTPLSGSVTPARTQSRARFLRSGRAGAIGVIYDTQLTYALRDPAASAFLSGVGEPAEDDRLGLLLVPGTKPEQRDTTPVRAAIVDGFLIYSVAAGDPLLAAVLDRGLPTVIVDQPSLPDVPFVGIDDRAAAAAAAGHALALGHRRLAVLSFGLSPDADSGFADATRQASAAYPVTRARLAGYADAAAAVGLDWADVPVYECRGSSRTLGAAGASELRNPHRARPRCSPPATNSRSAPSTPLMNEPCRCPKRSRSSASTTPPQLPPARARRSPPSTRTTQRRAGAAAHCCSIAAAPQTPTPRSCRTAWSPAPPRLLRRGYRLGATVAAGDILRFVDGSEFRITKSAADTNGEYLEMEWFLPPSTEMPPKHVHPKQREDYEVMEGGLEVFVGNRWQSLRAGETASAPAGTVHTFRAGDQHVRVRNVHAPALLLERASRWTAARRSAAVTEDVPLTWARPGRSARA